jgi:hypothetical protein
MPPEAALARCSLNIPRNENRAISPAHPQKTVSSGSWFRGSSLAECFLHRSEPSFVVAVQAVRVDPQQHLDGMPGPLGDQRRGSPGVEPPGDSRMTEVVGLRASGEAAWTSVNAHSRFGVWQPSPWSGVTLDG